MDPDGNDAILRYKLNEGSFTQVYSGPSNEVTFEIPITALVDGSNTLILQAVDSYNFQTQKRVRLIELSTVLKSTRLLLVML